MSLLFDKLKKDRPNLSKESLTSYHTTYKQLKAHFGIESPKDAKFLFDYAKLKSFINGYANPNTRKSKVIAVLVFMSTLKDKTPKEKKIFDKIQVNLSDLNDNYFEKQSTQEKSEKQKKNFITMKDFEGVIRDLKQDLIKADYKRWVPGDLNKKEFTLMSEYMLLRMYYEFPVRNDFWEVKILPKTIYEKLPSQKQDGFNYILTEKGLPTTLQINRFKTRSSLGRQSMSIPEKLGKILNTYIKLIDSDMFLFVKEKDRSESISSNDISKILNRVFKRYFPDKSVSTSVLRHVQTEAFSKKNGIPSQKEAKKLNDKIENKFLHSAVTNQKIYRKDK